LWEAGHAAGRDEAGANVPLALVLAIYLPFYLVAFILFKFPGSRLLIKVSRTLSF